MTGAASTSARTAVLPEDLAAGFLYVHDLLRAPSEAQWEWLTAATTQAFHERLGKLLGVPGVRRRLALPDNFSNYESEYIAAFDSGAPHAPVPLIESHYNRQTPVPKVLHENILYYQAFGLRLRSTANETSDHLRHQLEFVAHLLNMEVAASEHATVAPEETVLRLAQLRRAREEFVQRRMLSWLPRAVAAAQRMPWRWVGQSLELAHGVVQCAAGSSSDATQDATPCA